MDEQQFRVILERELAPLLEGRISPDHFDSTDREQLVSFVQGAYRIAVKPTRTAGYRVAIDRSQAYDPVEKGLAEHFIEELSAIVDLNSDKYFNDLLLTIPRRVVARHLSGGSILEHVLEQLEIWAAQTYEGQRVVASIGIEPSRGPAGVTLRDFWIQDFAHILTNGFDTIVRFNTDGNHLGFEQLPYGPEQKYAPHRLRQVCYWARNRRIAAVLNRHGEILVFKDQALRFAKRKGRWIHYVHDTNIKRLSPPKNMALREALYQSCLDVSYARNGGCIGVLDSGNVDLISTLAKSDDLLSKLSSYKTQLIAESVKPNFQSLDRRFRQELISMDGAVVLDHKGTFLAAGAILQIPAGSTGGGRLAAALELSKSGLGIKISQDGTIIAFRNEQEIFKT